MAFQFVLLCASALLVQSISAQCIGNLAGIGLAGNGLAGYGLAGNGLAGYGLAGNGLAGVGANNGLNGLSNGGGFVVTSSSPISPTGLSVLAENLVIEGPLSVGGQMPLLGAVALEGQLPTGGQAGISYSCGNGNVGIVGEVGGPNVGYGAGLAGNGLVGAGLAGPGLVGAGPAGPGLVGAGLAGPGLIGPGLAGSSCGRLY